MNATYLFCYFCVLIACSCGFYRLYVGPGTLNRILAFDYICACIIAFIALYSAQHQTDQHLELILIFSLLGFATVVSFMEAFFSKAQGDKID